MHAKKNACKSREISAFYSQVEFPFLSTLSGLKTLKIKNDWNKFLESNPEHITLWTTTYANAGKSNNIADRNSTLYVCMCVGCFAGSRHALMVQFVRSELVADTCSSNRVGPSNRNPFVLLHLILIVILNSNRIRIAHALMMRHYLHMP